MTVHSDAADDAKMWRIQPTPPSFAGQLAALWRHRQLSGALARQVLSDRAEKSLLGVPWLLVQPIMIAVPAAFILGNVFGVSVAPLPLPMFIIAGLAGWTLFRRGVQMLTKSISGQRSLMRRIYIPVYLLLCASISPAFVQFLVLTTILAALAVYYGPIAGIYYVPFGWHLLAIVPTILLLVLAAIGVSCFTAILYAMRRDTLLMLRYVLVGWMLATPVIYPAEIIPESHRWMLYLNPLTPVIELFRWALLGYGTLNLSSLAIAVAVILALVLLGGMFFSKLQNRIFDHM